MSQDPQSPYDLYPRHRTHPSLTTSASGVADSTISFNTYATGITEGSLNLSQFPPPPATLPSSPAVERFVPSPTQSTSTVTAHARAYPGIDQGQPSPARSTFTITAHAQNHGSRSATPIVRPGHMLDRDLSSPALSSFTFTSPPSIGITSSLGHGMPERPQNSDPRAESQTPTPVLRDGKLSPYDWHDGSSILSVDPTEERMLSTSLITGLLSSTTPDKTPSPGDGSPQGLHPPPSQAGVSNRVSEMSFPLSLHYDEPVAGSGHFLPTSHPSTFPGEGPDFGINGENDTMASFSDGEHANLVRSAHGLTRRVSVGGIAPATLRHMSSDTDVSESIHPRSQVTYGSTAPLNPHLPPVFSSAMDKMQTTNIQPSMSISQLWTPERPVSPDCFSGKKPGKPQRRASAQSSRTVRSHVSSLISSVGQRTARAARATMGWMRVKPLPPIPTIPQTSIYQEQEHRRIEGAVPLPQLADRADRLAVMLDSGHFPHNSIIHPSRFSSDKGSLTGSRRPRGAKSDKFPPEGPPSPRKFKLFLKLPIDRKVKLFIGASVLALLVLIGIIVGVVVGRRHAHSMSCSGNRTGNTCSLSECCAPWLVSRSVYRPT